MRAMRPLTTDDVRAALDTRQLGRSLTCLDETGSTSDVAHRLGSEGLAHGHVVIADRQTSGRGRRGRSWVSPPGANLYASILLRPQLEPRHAPELTLVAAVAFCEALRDLGAPVVIKWPNDLQIEGRKVGGILTEMSGVDGKVGFVVLGVGVNVNLNPEELPPELSAVATSLKEALGRELDRAQVLSAMLSRLERWLEVHAREGFEPVRARWSELSSTLGARVRVNLESQSMEGEAVGLDLDGALLLREDSGEVRRIVAGDVENLRGSRG